jgi:hypothetical protein
MQQVLGAQTGVERFLPRFVGNQQLVVFKHHSLANMGLNSILIQAFLSHLAFLFTVKSFVQVLIFLTPWPQDFSGVAKSSVL